MLHNYKAPRCTRCNAALDADFDCPLCDDLLGSVATPLLVIAAILLVLLVLG